MIVNCSFTKDYIMNRTIKHKRLKHNKHNKHNKCYDLNSKDLNSKVSELMAKVEFLEVLLAQHITTIPTEVTEEELSNLNIPESLKSRMTKDYFQTSH